MSSLTQEAWLRLSSLASATRIAKLFSLVGFKQCSPILIKGWSVERFYDQGSHRISSDIDLLLPEDQNSDVLEIVKRVERTVTVDLHFGPRRLDILSFKQLLEHSYEVDLDGTPVRVLADEDNLRITAVHWLTDGGVNKEKLWDVYYLVKNRKPDFDWARCLESNGPIRKTWVMAAIATARDYLQLNVSGLPEEAQRFRLPEWYDKTLAKEWKRGVYPRHVLSSVITRPKLLLAQLYRRFPPNKIAASIDTETPIDDTSRIPSQIKSLTRKVMPFARGIARRLTYSERREQDQPQ